ncbi:MAG: hypothetical protein V4819_06995 [Verrucomicrobiota bacterium]
MKIPRVSVFLALLGVTPVWAQVDFPANPTVAPKKYTTRAIGGGVNPGASVDPGKSANPTMRYITHIVLCDTRMWTSTEGKPLEAKLIAFEDLVAEAPTGSAEPVMPAPPANPTGTRGGKVRLLVNRKPVETALDRLSPGDREFVDQLQAALAKKAAAGR